MEHAHAAAIVAEVDELKTVWTLNHYAAEPGGIGGTRHFHLAEGLAKNGWESIVIASGIELNSGRQRLQPGEMKRLEDCKGVRFLWVRVPGYTGNGGGRMWNMLSYSMRVLMPSITRGLPAPDAVIGSSVHPFAAVSAAFLARRFNVPFVFEVRDLWPQTLIDLGRLKAKSPMAKVMGWIERWLYRRAEKIVVLLPHAADYIVPLGIDPAKIVWIPNGVDLSLFPIEQPRTETTDPFTLMYFGAHGQANALEPLIDAMAVLVRRPHGSAIRLRLIGDGDRKKALLARAQSLSLDESAVSFEDPVAKRDIPRLAAEADAFVIHVPDRAELYRYGISPNKLFDYMAAGRPIVMACAENIDFTRVYGCGVWARPEDPEALADAFERMAAIPVEERRRMGVNGRTAVEENFSFDQLSKSFALVLDDSVSTCGKTHK